MSGGRRANFRDKERQGEKETFTKLLWPASFWKGCFKLLAAMQPLIDAETKCNSDSSVVIDARLN